LLITGPDRSPVRDPENRSGSINVAAQVKAILIELRDKRKLRIEELRNKRIKGKEPAFMKRVLEEELPVRKFAEEFTRYQKSLELGGDKFEKSLAKSLMEENKLIMAAPFKYARRRGDEHSETKALSSHRRPTKVERFQQRVLNDENEPLPRLRGLYNSARSISFRPTVRQQPQTQPSPQNKVTPPQTQVELLGKQVQKHGDRVPLRKITFYVIGRHGNVLPHPDRFRLPKWAEDTLTARGYKSKDVLNWIRVMRATNATQAFEIMERNGAVWPKFLIQSMLYSSTPRSQNELVKIFSVIQDIWDAFDQVGKIEVLIRMAVLFSKKLPQGLPRVANLLATTDFVGKKSILRVFNEVLGITADAYHHKQHQNYTTVVQLRNFIEESMITLLDEMEKKGVHVKIRTLRKVSAAKLAENSDAAIAILRLGKPKKYIDLLEDMKGQEEDLALAYEVAKAERQLSGLEREFLNGHLLGRVTSKEMIKRLNTIQNWRISTQETFSAWLEFLDRRRRLGPAPKETWISILQMCHDEWTFPSEFWQEAFDLMEEDNVLPNTRLLCLVLKGIKEMDVLDRILETATTTHFQRMNDQIWQVYLQRLAINHAPRALEIFLNAHTTDSAAGTMDTLNIYYWNILLNGLAGETHRTNDMIWITRAFDLLAEMERLSIFPSQQTLSAICKLGNFAGDKVRIKDVPAWKAAMNQWHEWIIRPEDFGYAFNLPGIAKLIPSQVSFRRFIRLAGNYGEYAEVFDASWAMMRFGVIPDWDTLLDIDLFMQLSRDVKRTVAVREMFREWLGRYPTPREVIWHYRRWLRAEVRMAVEERAKLEAPETAVAKQIEAPRTVADIRPDAEVRQETVVEQWLRREREKPWFERD
jgi:hypothetical protein